VRSVGPDRVELSSNLVETERAQERFQYSYLPPSVETLFREALQCYAAGCHNAFASMCRRTLQATLEDTGRNARLRWYDLLKDVIGIGQVDEQTSQIIENILFGSGNALPEIGADQAAVLIEVIKDMIYQGYVRTAKLRAAMKMRRYFAEEHDGNITSIEQHRAESA
jgi:hypothetical protein